MDRCGHMALAAILDRFCSERDQGRTFLVLPSRPSSSPSSPSSSSWHMRIRKIAFFALLLRICEFSPSIISAATAATWGAAAEVPKKLGNSPSSKDSNVPSPSSSSRKVSTRKNVVFVPSGPVKTWFEANFRRREPIAFNVKEDRRTTCG